MLSSEENVFGLKPNENTPSVKESVFRAEEAIECTFKRRKRKSLVYALLTGKRTRERAWPLIHVDSGGPASRVADRWVPRRWGPLGLGLLQPPACPRSKGGGSLRRRAPATPVIIVGDPGTSELREERRLHPHTAHTPRRARAVMDLTPAEVAFGHEFVWGPSCSGGKAKDWMGPPELGESRGGGEARRGSLVRRKLERNGRRPCWRWGRRRRSPARASG